MVKSGESQHGGKQKGGLFVLMGTFYPAMDAKGRISFPAKLREALGESFILTKGLDGCLFVYSQVEWNKLKERINGLPLSKSRNLQRFFFAGAGEVEPDKQGRFVVPPPLREYACLNGDIVVIGASNRAEIWSLEQWEKNSLEVTEDMVIETMDEIGF